MYISRLILRVAVACLAWAAAAAAQNPACGSCHHQAQKLPGTAHAAQDCTTCHAGREKFPHPAGAATLKCYDCHSLQADQTAIGVHGVAKAQGNQAAPDCSVCHGDAHEIARPGTTPFRRKVADTCGMCHADIAAQYKTSVHGQAVERGVRDAPECADCHGEHATVKPSQRVRETCSRCHANLALTSKFGLPADRVVSYEASFHGLAARAGSQTVANCGSCHGVHTILPSSDPKSTIYPANLSKTCGACHPGAGRRFALGPVHVVAGRAEAPILGLLRRLYIWLIAIVIGLMAVHNGGDWVRKLRARFRGEAPRQIGVPTDFRMYPEERVQHALLAVSFLVLAWTGFALKYPQELWARPLLAWESSWPVRGWIHRAAAAVFLVTALLHMAALATSARLRRHWRSLLPRRTDLTEALAGLAYRIGLRERPRLSSHSYIEKAEYWAVVWGAVIMSGSGLLLWANDFFLARLPKLALDLATVIHFYEAVLATLAIVVWHFYFVIFDPDVYPMDPAWLRGFSNRPRQAEPGSAEEPSGDLQPSQGAERAG